MGSHSAMLCYNDCEMGRESRGKVIFDHSYCYFWVWFELFVCAFTLSIPHSWQYALSLARLCPRACCQL
jgi:hypothetical protein